MQVGKPGHLAHLPHNSRTKRGPRRMEKEDPPARARRASPWQRKAKTEYPGLLGDGVDRVGSSRTREHLAGLYSGPGPVLNTKHKTELQPNPM